MLTPTPIDPLAQRLADTLVQGARFRVANAAGQEVGLMYVPAGRSARGGGAGCYLLRVESGDTPDLDVFDLPLDAAVAFIAAVGPAAASNALDRHGLPPHLFPPMKR